MDMSSLRFSLLKSDMPSSRNFTTRISPFYDDITIDVRRGVRQGDTVSPKLFTATLKEVMRRLEWDSMEVRVDGRLLHHLRFADGIVLRTPNISQAERMRADFDDACGKIGLQLNLTKTMFMRNGWVLDAPFSLNGTNISDCSSYFFVAQRHYDHILFAPFQKKILAHNKGLDRGNQEQ
ncbi:hypothetical protein ANCCEY_09499 [Ancylostoma ceylanicum]|uniref:Reverse transcriptase domain-containing protein n=1 Tax=Ancylostoma ceylanicum TaxID=53326 RepID=A0A0D6LN08_9BILA|nr:hypothetical protein ANCCEY_09499 [Ancylostoma ceylanicum]